MKSKRNTIIKKEVVYPHSIQKVWDAITRAESVSEWLFSASEIKLSVGHKFELGDSSKVYCEILEVEEPHKLVYTWNWPQMGYDTAVRWTLKSMEEGTLLKLEHYYFEDDQRCKEHNEGWQNYLGKSLRTLLDAGNG